MSALASPFQTDLEEIRLRLSQHLSSLRRARILIAGGTGIVGKWLLFSLLYMDQQEGLDIRITVLSRDPQKFSLQFPALGGDPRICWLQGDARTFDLMPGCSFSHVIHAATDVVASISAAEVFDTCFTATQNILRMARQSGASRLLLLSSGAVYGKTSQEQGAISESYVGPLDMLDPTSAYAQGKRSAELLCAIESTRGALAIPIARCFAMVGPYLPLDKHFAIGNFIQAALARTPLLVQGDGTPIRSYLYMSDVTERLLLLLLAGRSGAAYNIGGSVPVTISELAQCVVSTLDVDVEVQIRNVAMHGAHANRYYPNTELINKEFSLPPEIPLSQAIRRTANWHQTSNHFKE